MVHCTCNDCICSPFLRVCTWRVLILSRFLQDDKDLVHEFVVAEGLTCLIKVGAEADQNYQNYILRGTSTPMQLFLSCT